MIALYIIYLYNISSKKRISATEAQELRVKKEKIIMQYAKFKNLYSQFVNSKNTIINNVVYAIMIYEDFKVPQIYRKIKSYISIFASKETKQGIMQINSKNKISDEESIQLVISTFEKDLKNKKLKEYEKIDILLSNYSPEEKEKILLIYKVIIEFIKK